MDFCCDLNFYDDIFSFSDEFREMIKAGDYVSALKYLDELLEAEKKDYNSINSFLADLLNDSSECDLMTLNEIEKDYDLLNVCSYRISNLEKIINQIKAFVKLIGTE